MGVKIDVLSPICARFGHDQLDIRVRDLGVRAYTPLRLGEGRFADTKPWLLHYQSHYPPNASMYQIPPPLHQRLPVVMPLW